MRMLETLKWINSRGAPLAVLALLLAAGVFIHHMALVRLDMTDGRLPDTGAPTEGRLQLIVYVGAHPWLALLFAALFAGSLLWLQFRRLPRWSLWLTFALLALPVFGYMWVCMRVSTAPIIWRR